MYANRTCNFPRTTQSTIRAGFESRVLMVSLMLSRGDLEPKGLEQRSGVFLMLGLHCSCDLAGVLLVP